eukprot:1157300-Pelagomonas_calceolata.AAC.2
MQLKAGASARAEAAAAAAAAGMPAAEASFYLTGSYREKRIWRAWHNTPSLDPLTQTAHAVPEFNEIDEQKLLIVTI